MVSMRQVRVVLVEPLYPVNLGSVARVLKNFGVHDLVLVRPKAQADAVAKKYAKRSFPILEHARHCETLEEALQGTGWGVATTGVPRRYHRGLKKCWSLKEAVERTPARGKVAVVFGNEGTGLSERDLDSCDAVATIPSDRKYPVMNLSHAVAVTLYELACGRKRVSYYPTAKREDTRVLARLFEQAVTELPQVHDKKKVGKAFRNVLRRARVSKDELQSLFAAVGVLRKNLQKKK